MKIHIYKIYFPTNNKCYIGQTRNLNNRLVYHLGSPYLVGKALRKYDDWIISILHTVKTRDEANRIEIEEIRNHNCVVPNGYNLTHGGEGGDFWSGRKHTEESIEKIREANTGHSVSKEIRERIRKKLQGFHPSAKTRKKMSESHIGCKPTEETRKKLSNWQVGRKCPWVAERNKSTLHKYKCLRARLTKLENEC